MKLAIITLLLSGLTVFGQNKILKYEPKVSTIRGELKLEKFYGAPGYGENPKTDKLDFVYILYLDKPVDVLSNGKDEVNETEKDVRKIHLTGNIEEISKFDGRRIKATGTLFHSHTGHHRTKVLMAVQTMSPNPR